MLVKSRNNHASEFQMTTCMYFLACSASRSLFDVLNHAGLTLSYTQAVAKLKQLGAERLEEMHAVARTQAVMIIWDNLNIAFNVTEQRHDSKAHFDNGTTATLIPLFGVEFGGLPLDLLPHRNNRLPLLSFGPADLLPSLEEARRVEDGQLWHIQNILYDAFPNLRDRFHHEIEAAPSVYQIPLHKTKQYPLPAMHIDESSLDGTLEVLDTIVTRHLKFTAEDLQKHGILICAGDQLSKLLVDKVSLSLMHDESMLTYLWSGSCGTSRRLGPPRERESIYKRSRWRVSHEDGG